jgi:hypothetical protein
MRWMVILLAAAPLAYAADPSEVEKPATSEATPAETVDRPADPDYVSEAEAEHFKALGYRHQKQEGEMKWCRREGQRITGSRFKQLVCRTPEQVRAMQETVKDAKKTTRHRAE